MVQQDVARVRRGGDVEEGQLVGALAVVAAGDLDRIAGVAQLHEVDALDDAAGGHVQAGNDSLGEHGASMTDGLTGVPPRGRVGLSRRPARRRGSAPP
jgi:hypothetical protein